jgi:hypothetical protein
MRPARAVSRPRRRAPGALVLLLGAAAVTLSACGIPVDTAAHSLAPVHVEVAPLTPGGSPGTPVTFTLYFVSGTKLVPVRRAGYAYSSVEDTADLALLDLQNGPTTKEGPGLTTLLSNQANSNNAVSCTFDPVNHIATVALDAVPQFFTTLFGPTLYDAFGQIVLTLLENPALSVIHAVQFTADGGQTFAYLPTGTIYSRPVTAAPYLELVRTPVVVTTTLPHHAKTT